jgi:glycosyltransferase involved in cell wall biosynthesis
LRGIRDELKLRPETHLIAIIGQIILRKGQDTALAAAVAALRDRPNVHALVIGARHSTKPETIEYERRLHQIVADGGIADRVHFLGTRDDLATLLPQTTFLLHTARQEPLGRVLLEAAACGVPVVATDVGGTREIFPREAEDGALLIPLDDAAAATTAVANLLDDAELRKRLGPAGRRRIESAFSVERAAVDLLEQYQAASGRGVG